MGSKNAEWAMKVFTNLPQPLQERLQEVMMKSLQNPYYIPNLSIIAAYILAYLPHFIKAGFAILYKGINYNNETPRNEKWQEYGSFGGVMTRAYAAHMNALEMFPAFAAGVLVAKTHKAKPNVLTALCVKYLGLRILYTFCYIFGVNKAIAALRTIVWLNLYSNVVQIYALAL